MKIPPVFSRKAASPNNGAEQCGCPGWPLVRKNSYESIIYYSSYCIILYYIILVLYCVCVFFPFILDIKFLDIPAGVIQDFTSTFLLRCAP